MIIQARVQEIFELVGKELDRSGLAAAACARVVLTGGLTKMDGALDVAETTLRRPVRLGKVEIETPLSQFESDPTHAVVLGMVLRGLVCREQKLDRRFDEEGWRAMFRRVAGWL
jgi:cell division protein FtsA